MSAAGAGHRPPAGPDGPAPDTVVFDLGGVLAAPDRLVPTLAGLAGVPESRFEAAYWAHREGHDLGGTDGDYWSAVLADCGLTGPTRAADPGLPGADTLPARLSAADAVQWTQLLPGPAALVDALALAGVRLGLLSNAPHSLGVACRAAQWAAAFDALVFSGDQGIVKPDRRIYDLTASVLAAEPARLLFFDDRADNVAGARAAGWRAEVWAGTEVARAMLCGHGLL